MIMKALIGALEDIPKKKSEELEFLLKSDSKIVIIGHGGSNSIASHISQDYTKKLGKKSFSFSDPSRLTCYINDYGIENAFSQFLKEFSDSDTLVILISSSGKSDNIVGCVNYCLESQTAFIMLTGCDEYNSCRSLAKKSNLCKLEYWVDSTDYGVVECAHQAFVHSAV